MSSRCPPIHFIWPGSASATIRPPAQQRPICPVSPCWKAGIADGELRLRPIGNREDRHFPPIKYEPQMPVMRGHVPPDGHIIVEVLDEQVLAPPGDRPDLQIRNDWFGYIRIRRQYQAARPRPVEVGKGLMMLDR